LHFALQSYGLFFLHANFSAIIFSFIAFFQFQKSTCSIKKIGDNE